jgi:hypothetical protein
VLINAFSELNLKELDPHNTRIDVDSRLIFSGGSTFELACENGFMALHYLRGRWMKELYSEFLPRLGHGTHMSPKACLRLRRALYYG